MTKSTVLTVSGVLAILSLAVMFNSCSQQQETPKLSAQYYKDKFKDVKESEGHAEHGIKEVTKWLSEMRINPNTGTVDINDIYRARLQAMRMRNSSANKQTGLNLEWENLGPDNVGGRTRALMIDKNNTQHLIVGSVTGGLFVSTDGALSWTEHPENYKFISTSISSIVQAANGDIYVGTGETFVYTQPNGDGHIGGGVYKSTDGGNTFDLLPATEPAPNNAGNTWAYVSKIAADPFDGNKIYAATNGGLYYTLDGGDNWNAAQGIAPADNNKESRDVKISTNGVVIAEINKKCYRSINGLDFQLVSGSNGFPSTNVQRLEFAISPQDADYMYAAIANSSSGLRGIYRSIDGGVNWAPYSQENSSVFNPLGQQGDYNIAFAVNPSNKNEVVIGGQLECWKGGLDVGWDMVAYWIPETPTNPYYIHADMHFAVFDPTNPDILYVCSDGGVSKSTNASEQFPSFTPRNKNYITTQFYDMAANPSGEVMAGAQDNGTVYIDYKGNTTRSGLDVRGGDGGYCAISQLNRDIVFSEIQYGALSRSLNRGGSFGSMWDDYALTLGAGSPGFSQFIAPYDLWEERKTIVDSVVVDTVTMIADTFKSFKDVGYLVFGASGRIMITPDALEAGGVYWYSKNVGGAVSAVTPTPSGNFYVGTTSGNLYHVTGLRTATFNRQTNVSTGITVTQIRNGSQWSGSGGARYISSVGVDPQDEGHIVVTFGGYGLNSNIFTSNDALAGAPVFTSVQSDLPNMPVYSAIIDRYNPSNLIAGTDFGIWSSIDAGNTWTQELNGIYNTPVYSVMQQPLYSNDCYVLYTATYGRGMFRSTTLTSQNNSTCSLVSGIEDKKPVTDVKVNIYPNPASSELHVDFNLAQSGNVTLRIVDVTGRELLAKNYGSKSAGKVSLLTSVNTLPAGVYIVAIQTPTGLVTRQLVVSK